MADEDEVLAELQTVKADGYAIEALANGVELRRQVFAGDEIPVTWRLEPAEKKSSRKKS
jgi:hypothetical protein